MTDSTKPGGAGAPVPVVGGFVAYPDPITGETIYRNATDEEKEASARYYAKLTPAEIQAMARVVITAESTDEAWAAASKVFVSTLRYPAQPGSSAVLERAAEYVRGQRSRDAEVERLRVTLAEAHNLLWLARTCTESELTGMGWGKQADEWLDKK